MISGLGSGVVAASLWASPGLNLGVLAGLGVGLVTGLRYGDGPVSSIWCSV